MNKLLWFIVLFALIVMSCATTPVATQAPLPTYAPYPTQVPARPSCKQTLANNGFSSEGFSTGSNGISYEVFRNSLHLVVLVYPDGGISIIMFLGYDADAQVRTVANISSTIYGNEMMAWILTHGAQLTNVGQEFNGTIGNWNIKQYIDYNDSGELYEGIIIMPAVNGTSYQG